MWPDGEGPVYDELEAKVRGDLERDKPEHAPKENDPRDDADVDLDDPGKQEPE